LAQSDPVGSKVERVLCFLIKIPFISGCSNFCADYKDKCVQRKIAQRQEIAFMSRHISNKVVNVGCSILVWKRLISLWF